MDKEPTDFFALKKQVSILTQRADKLSILLNISKVMNTLTDIKSLIDIIVSLAIKVTNSDIGSLFLLDRKKNELWSLSARELGELQEIRFPSNKGIAGHVATTGEILNIEDAYMDSRFNKEIDIKSNYRTRTILCIPVKNSTNEIIGTLQVINKKEGIFTRLDEELMVAFCEQSATAIENTLKNKKSEDKLIMLSQAVMSINESVSILDMEGSIIFVNKSFRDIYGYSEDEILNKDCSILLKDKEACNDMKDKFLSRTISSWHGEAYSLKKDGTEFIAA